MGFLTFACATSSVATSLATAADVCFSVATVAELTSRLVRKIKGKE